MMNSGEDALDHRSRKQIFNYILSHPGSSFGMIKRVLDINPSTLKYHLHYLEKSKQVNSKREGRQRCYYSASETGSRDLLSNSQPLHKLTETQERILNVIKNKPGITKPELELQTRLNRTRLNYNLDRLSDTKLIWQVKNNGMAGYEFITKEDLRDEIFSQLVLKLLAGEIDEATYHKIKRKLETIDLDDLEAKR